MTGTVAILPYAGYIAFSCSCRDKNFAVLSEQAHGFPADLRVREFPGVGLP